MQAQKEAIQVLQNQEFQVILSLNNELRIFFRSYIARSLPFTLGTLSTLDKRWHQSLAFPVLLSFDLVRGRGLSLCLWNACYYPSPTNSRSKFADQRSQIFRCRNLSYKMKFDIWWSKCYCSPFPSHLGKPLWVSISVDLRPNPLTRSNRADTGNATRQENWIGKLQGCMICQSSSVKHIAIWMSL